MNDSQLGNCFTCISEMINNYCREVPVYAYDLRHTDANTDNESCQSCRHILTHLHKLAHMQTNTHQLTTALSPKVTLGMSSLTETTQP